MTWTLEKNQQRQPGKLQFIGPTVTPFNQTTTAANVGTARMSRSRVPIFFKEACLELRMPVVGWYIVGFEVMTAISQNWTLQASLELANTTKTSAAPFTWGSGATSKVIDPSITTEVLSDDWVATNGIIPAGWHWLNVQYDVPAAGMQVGLLLQAASSGPYIGTTSFYTAPGAALSPVNGIGPILNTGALQSGVYMPCLFQGLVGRYAVAHPATLGFGDSKRAGNGLSDGRAGTSAFSRMADQLGIPELNYGISNSTVQTAAALPGYAFTMAKYFTDFITNQAINDFTAGRTAAQVQADQTTLINMVKAINPNIRVWIAPTEPKVTISGISITAASTTGNTATMTVADATQVPAVGARCQILGFTGAGLAYNGVWTITAKDATTFSYVYQGTATALAGTPSVNDAYFDPTKQTDLFPTDRTAYNIWAKAGAGGLAFGVLDPNVIAESGGSGASGKWAAGLTTDSLHPNDIGYTAIGSDYVRQWLAQGGPSDAVAFR